MYKRRRQFLSPRFSVFLAATPRSGHGSMGDTMRAGGFESIGLRRDKSGMIAVYPCRLFLYRRGNHMKGATLLLILAEMRAFRHRSAVNNWTKKPRGVHSPARQSDCSPHDTTASAPHLTFRRIQLFCFAPALVVQALRAVKALLLVVTGYLVNTISVSFFA